MSQIWVFGGRMGPLNDALLHIGFNRPELFRVLLNNRAPKPQAAVVSLTRAFDFPPLNGSVNPADGQVYVAGFFIRAWGTTATRLAGVARVRYTGAASTIPTEVAAMDNGILLRFEVPLDPSVATAVNRYAIMSWHYQRTYKYGSPQFKADGTPGMDRLTPSAAYLSRDGRSVFIAVPGMKPVMQMQVGWSLRTAGGGEFAESAYFTPYQLTRFDPPAEGFGDITVDLSPTQASAVASAEVSAGRGRAIAESAGCAACHAMDQSSAVRVGPALTGLFGARRAFANGIGTVVADESYIRESILDPPAKIAPGFERSEAGMPSYAGVLTPEEIESIVLYLKTLK
jgi:cytochrome c2